MPPLAIALALSSAFIHASWNALLKGGRDRLADSFLVALGCAGVGLVLIAFTGPPNAAAWPYLIASLIIHAVYWLCVIKGYDAGDLSHVYTLSRGLAPAIVAVGAAFAVHEIPALGDAIGIALVCAGVLCVGVSAHAPLRASLWGGLTALAIAAYSLVDALGARAAQDALTYIGWVSLFTGLPLGVFAFARRGPRILIDVRRDLFRGLFAGIVSSLGFGLVLYAQTFAPIAQVTALRETSILFAALIAWLFLKEPMGPRRWIGAGIVAAGAMLIGFA
ncbi:MAG: EamA family transporter [Alphaproteobacteria bacterium]|nr:EamA family transporter [Alphaproteobacteria bacterium]